MAPQPEPVPQHVAIIMDGNRRWARAHSLPIAEGYRRGVTALRAAVRGAAQLGVKRLSVYGFSTENWRREPDEVDLIMQLCAGSALGELPSLRNQGVRVEVIGDLEAFTLPARAAVRKLVNATAQNTGLTLVLALNYGGREEILRAARSLAIDVASGALKVEQIDEVALRARMFAPHAPDPDLLIRTGGEQRISNFLLFHLAYTELLTIPEYWPDFNEATLTNACNEYVSRTRRFGE